MANSKYNFLISYSFQDSNGNAGFGNTSISSDSEFLTIEDVDDAENTLEKAYGLKAVAVMAISRLADSQSKMNSFLSKK